MAEAVGAQMRALDGGLLVVHALPVGSESESGSDGDVDGADGGLSGEKMMESRLRKVMQASAREERERLLHLQVSHHGNLNSMQQVCKDSVAA